MIGSDQRGSKLNVGAAADAGDGDLVELGRGLGRVTTWACQSVSVPVTSTSRCGSTARTAACSGRIEWGPQSVIQPPSTCAGESRR